MRVLKKYIYAIKFLDFCWGWGGGLLSTQSTGASSPLCSVTYNYSYICVKNRADKMPLYSKFRNRVYQMKTIAYTTSTRVNDPN